MSLKTIIFLNIRIARPLYAFLFLLTCNLSFAQLSIRDSLNKEIIKYKKEAKSIQDTTYINLILELAIEQRYYKSDSLRILSKEALSLSNNTNYNIGKANSFIGLGVYNSDQGKYDKAIMNYKEALYIAIQLNDNRLKLKALNYIAGANEYKGDFDLALRDYLKAMEIGESTDNKKMLSVVNENIANLYLSQKDYKQAMLFYNKVKDINERIGDPVIMAETMSNMASAYADMGKLDHAMFNVNSAIKIFEDHKILDWLAYAYDIKGKTYLKQQKNKWAIYWYRQSELLHKVLEDERSEISMLYGIAKANLNLKKDSISEAYAKKAYRISKKIEDLTGIQEGSKILYEINKNKEDYKTALNYHEIYETVTKDIIGKENKKGLTMLKTKIEYEQQKEQLILANEKALAKQKTYVYLALIALIIFLGITLLVRKNARVQKTLNKELISKQEDLEKKEENLQEINNTKNKLFSIIGHDLRGPIGAFQALIKLFKEGEMPKEEFLNLVPKLKSDIDHIAFTLNNLLSWGQTQMNGSVTKPGTTSLETIVQENISLLSEIANNKSIKIINRTEANTLIWCDSDQLDIIVRNLISNALKFTPENGVVTIGATEKTKHWEIYVRDNGIGMNKETLGKIFNKTGTHSTTYGTNDEKGTGLGLSLCKEMVENNKGLIWVDSALHRGSSFYFKLPKAQNPYKKTA